MFKFHLEMSKKEEKKFIDWVVEIYQHLIQVEDNENEQDNLFNTDKHNLIDLGLIDNLDTIGDFERFIDNKVKIFNFVEFMQQLKKVEHVNGKCLIPKYCEKCRNKALLDSSKDDKPVLIDLFCGAGGMSLGFNQAGFKTIFANDIEECCIETYKFNHPEVDPTKVVLGDIKELAETVKKYVEEKSVDIVIGGPPCQGFSLANQQRLIDDPRNKLYREYVKVVELLSPKFFVMENVEGMKNIASQVVEDFNAIGYTVEYRVLNAFDYGVPQNRKRLIFIGNKLDLNNEFIFNEISNNSKHIPSRNLFDAIGDLPKLKALRVKNATNLEIEECGRRILVNKKNDSNLFVDEINSDKQIDFIYNHKSRYNNDRDIEIFGRLDQGDKSDDPKIADIMPYASRNGIFKDKYYKLVYNKPSKTITAHMKFDCNMYIHPTQARGLTAREAARVQSFPDNYFFKGSFTKTYMQIGNSVPPLMAKNIGQVIMDNIQKDNK